MLLLLLWTSATFCGEEKEKIKHMRLPADHRLGSDVDKSFYPCRFRETSEASGFGLSLAGHDHALMGMAVHFSSEGVQKMNCRSTLASDTSNAVMKPENTVLASHPSEVLCVIQARQTQRKAPGIHSALFAVLGLVSGCKYKSTLLLWSQIHGTVMEGAICSTLTAFVML